MNLLKSIADFGTDAVLRYRTVSGIEPDNEVPECWLGSFLAGALHDALGLRAHVEHSFKITAERLAVTLDAEMRDRLGQSHADLALYEGATPLAAVEFKIVDEHNDVPDVMGDVEKLRHLHGICRIQCYVGAMVTDKARREYPERIRMLNASIGTEPELGSEQLSSNGKWKWRFAAWRIA